MRTDGRQPTPAIPKSSFAFGWGVNYEDAYLHRIVEGLRVPGKQVELVKLGTPGLGFVERKRHAQAQYRMCTPSRTSFSRQGPA